MGINVRMFVVRHYPPDHCTCITQRGLHAIRVSVQGLLVPAHRRRNSTALGYSRQTPILATFPLIVRASAYIAAAKVDLARIGSDNEEFILKALNGWQVPAIFPNDIERRQCLRN